MVGYCWAEELLSSSMNYKERVAQELVKGREYASRLKAAVNGSETEDHHDLTLKILASFTEALSLLTTATTCESQEDSVVCCEDSGESSRRAPAIKDKRGCYKRKKSSESWTKVSATVEDGQAWRKYGQKEILNAKYPRSYFRCTHKYDQGCKATKQVQKMEDNPQMYLTTYIGYHTCTSDNHFLSFPQIITTTVDTTTPHLLGDSNNYNIIFTSNNNNNNIKSSTNTTVQLPLHHHPIIIKEEEEEEETPITTVDHDSVMWKDLVPLDDFHFDETQLYT